MTSPLVYIEKQYNFLEPVQDSKIVSAARLMRSRLGCTVHIIFAQSLTAYVV